MRDVQNASLFSVEILHGAGQCPISLKKHLYPSVAWDFQEHEESFPGERIVSSVMGVSRSREFCQNSDSDSLNEGATSGHRFVCPCPLTGLVKSKNNITREPRIVMQMNTAM